MPSIRALTIAAVVLAGALAGCGDEDPKDDDLGGAWTATLAVTTAWSQVAQGAAGTADV
jgi:outer membrane murein-binding lipoprotein Lpp